jgi:hypothetical protein
VVQASAAKELRTALFWVITWRIVVITTNRCLITQKSAVFLPNHLSTHTNTQVRQQIFRQSNHLHIGIYNACNESLVCALHENLNTVTINVDHKQFHPARRYQNCLPIDWYYFLCTARNVILLRLCNILPLQKLSQHSATASG